MIGFEAHREVRSRLDMNPAAAEQAFNIRKDNSRGESEAISESVSKIKTAGGRRSCH
jgi:hypothetical protein